MRLSCEVSELLGPLQLCTSATGKLPPLSGVHCEAVAGLTLTATDNEVGVRVQVAADVDEAGECLLPPKLLDILKASPPGGTVKLAAGKTLIASVGEDVYELPLEDADGFPGLPPMPTGAIVIADCGIVRAAIDKTAFAAAKDEGKYAMRAVVWDGDSQGGLRLVATDGKRLAVTELGENRAAPTGVWLLPPRAVAIARGLCESGTAKVALRKNDAFISTDAGTVYTTLVEGRFPPWRDVIPKNPATTVELDAAQFCASVKRAALTADTEAKRVTCRFKPDGILMTAEGQPGRSAVRCPVRRYDGPAVDVHFDPSYLADVARGGEIVTLEMVDGLKSAVFRADGWTYLCVPLV